MIDRFRPVYVFLIILFLISLVYLKGVASVPFHPDESTYLFMSSDLSQVVKNPAAMFLREDSIDEVTRLRLLDPPLVHYAVEIGRRLGGFSPLPVNWNWSLSWILNEQRGALPSPQMLLMGRLAIACLFPFSLLLLYWTTRRQANEFSAWIAVLLMASNSLILLHTRRAMAEGIMIFTMTLTLWVLLKAEKRPWLSAIPIGLAFCAKQSLATLGIIGLLAVIWQPGRTVQFGKKIWQVFLYGMLFLVEVYLLTPIAWKYPLQTLQAGIEARQELISIQVKKYSAAAIKTPGESVIHLVQQTYFTPPMFYEDPSYVENTRASETAYLSNPWHTFSRIPLVGSILLALGLFGFAAGCYQASSRSSEKKKGIVLLLVATLLQILTLLVAIPLNWQRYYLPLIPYACIWAAYGAKPLKDLVNTFVKIDRKK